MYMRQRVRGTQRKVAKPRVVEREGGREGGRAMTGEL
jgi:hypothetical protein